MVLTARTEFLEINRKNFISKAVLVLLVLCLFVFPAVAQKNVEALRKKRIEFYRGLTAGSVMETLLDDSLSYGHSNGWIESKADFLANLGKRLVYHSISEDSLGLSVNGKYGYARFAGDFDVSLNGKRNTYRLRVLEVWVKRGKQWKIFARQAIK